MRLETRLGLVFLMVLMVSAISPGRADAQGVLTATDANFEELVGRSQPIVVFGNASWCGQCRPMVSIFEGLQADMRGQVRFAMLDVDANPKVPSRLGIMSIPTALIFKDGKLLARLVGAATKSKLVEWINTTVAASSR